jgi:hypothetical protein
LRVSPSSPESYLRIADPSVTQILERNAKAGSKARRFRAYLMWLLTAHVRRYHQHYRTIGHVWQGRLRAFPIQESDSPLDAKGVPATP